MYWSRLLTPHTDGTQGCRRRKAAYLVCWAGKHDRQFICLCQFAAERRCLCSRGSKRSDSVQVLHMQIVVVAMHATYGVKAVAGACAS